MARAALIGHPVAHSLSPRLFKLLGRRLKPALDYGAVDIAPGALEKALPRLAARRWLGLGVTRPHKQAVIPLLSRLTPEARACGAVNAIRFANGRSIGHNTDAAGFYDAVRRAGFSAKGQDAVVFGAGGAARAAACALGSAGARRVVFCARNKARARAAAKDLSSAFSKTEFSVGKARPAAFWINATPLGWKDSDKSPAPGRARCEAAFDMVYGRRTRFLVQAAEAGAFASDGLAMLAFQALRAWEFWFSRKIGKVRRAALAEELVKELEEPSRVRAR